MHGDGAEYMSDKVGYYWAHWWQPAGGAGGIKEEGWHQCSCTMVMHCIYSLVLQASSWSSQEWLVSGHSKFNINHSSKHILGTHEAWNNTPNTASSTPPFWPHHTLWSQPPLFICIPLTTIPALWTPHLLYIPHPVPHHHQHLNWIPHSPCATYSWGHCHPMLTPDQGAG